MQNEAPGQNYTAYYRYVRKLFGIQSLTKVTTAWSSGALIPELVTSALAVTVTPSAEVPKNGLGYWV